MSGQNLIRNDHLIVIVVISTLIISSLSIGNYSYFDILKVANGQSDSDKNNFNSTNAVNTQDIPLKKSILEILKLDIKF
jgi:hypothetical protein